MAIINHNSISGVTTVSVGSSIVVGDTFVITSNGLENITQISATGVITATSFSGALTGNVTGSATALSGTPDVTVGTLNATDAIISGDLTVQGTTTTLDTVVTEVDKLEVDANNTTVGVAITQSGTGDILRLYDGATQVVTVKDGGSVGIGTDNPSYSALHISGSPYYGATLRLTNTGTSGGDYFILSSDSSWTAGGDKLLIGRGTPATLNTKIVLDSSGRIGIGTEDPTAGTDGESDDLVIHRASGAAGMTIKTAANVTGAIRFADPDGASQGRIEYNHSSDYLRWNTGGSEKLRLDSSGNLSFAADTDTYIGRPAADTLALTTGGTERLRITSDGDLLSHTGGSATYDDITGASNAGLVIGSNSYLSSGIVVRTSGLGTCRLYFADNSGNDAGRRVGSIEYSHDNDKLAFTAGGSNTMNMYAGNVRISGPGSTSGTSQSPLAVSSNLGTITAFFGAQTDVRGLTVSQYSSAIRFNGAEVAWGDIAYFPNGDSNEGSFRFGRHGSTISSTPTATIGVSGVYFPGTSSSNANTLDDYEEGSWTPAFNNAGTLTYSVQMGRYTKIGNLVHVTCHIDVNSRGSASGNIEISGLPFTSIDVNNYHAVSSTVHGTNWSTARRSVNILLGRNNSTTNAIYHNQVGTTSSSNPSITGSDWGFVQFEDINQGNLLFSITYQAA